MTVSWDTLLEGIVMPSTKLQLGRMWPSSFFCCCCVSSELSPISNTCTQTSSCTCIWREQSRWLCKMWSISHCACSLFLPGFPLLSDEPLCYPPCPVHVARAILSKNAAPSFVTDHPDGQTHTSTPFLHNSEICDQLCPQHLVLNYDATCVQTTTEKWDYTTAFTVIVSAKLLCYPPLGLNKDIRKGL